MLDYEAQEQMEVLVKDIVSGYLDEKFCLDYSMQIEELEGNLKENILAFLLKIKHDYYSKNSDTELEIKVELAIKDLLELEKNMVESFRKLSNSLDRKLEKGQNLQLEKMKTIKKEIEGQWLNQIEKKIEIMWEIGSRKLIKKWSTVEN